MATMKTEDILERESELRAMREALTAYIVVFELDSVPAHDGPSPKTDSPPSGPRVDGSLESQ